MSCSRSSRSCPRVGASRPAPPGGDCGIFPGRLPKPAGGGGRGGCTDHHALSPSQASRRSDSLPPSPSVRRPVGQSQQLTDEEWARRLQLEYDQEAAEKAERASFKCPLCFDKTSFDDSVQLDCQHRICSGCFHGYLEVKIREKRVAEEELVCPMPGCGCEVTVPQVEGATRAGPLWDRFLAARAELWQPSKQDGECLCECPAKGCGARFLATALAGRWIRCPECRASFCRDCGCQHPGSSCEAHRAWRKENDRAEQEFDCLMQREKWQRCPSCKAACERQNGCNFMTCHSGSCRGKTFFCYICGQQLEHKQHYSHYPYGLFANGCLGRDRRTEAQAAPGTMPAPRTRRRERPDVDSNWLVRTLEEIGRTWNQPGR